MSDWDEDSEQLRANLRRVVLGIRREAVRRARPTVEAARQWQAGMMERLAVPNPEYRGRFRGEPGIERHEVSVGEHFGARSDRIGAELESFEKRLLEIVEELDALIPARKSLSADEVAAVLDVCAWTHSEWIRIHPFMNGNGRTARLWVVSIALRYGLPVFVRVLPRPAGGYSPACAAAMEGDWRLTARVFRRMYRETIRHRPT